jgi:hypothetical protein
MQATFWFDRFEKIMAGVEFGRGLRLPALHPALEGLQCGQFGLDLALLGGLKARHVIAWGEAP